MSSVVAKNLDQQITQYLPQLNDQQKKTVLIVMKSFIDDQKDWWNKISEEQKLVINHSLAEMKAGKLISHNKTLKRFQQ